MAHWRRAAVVVSLVLLGAPAAAAASGFRRFVVGPVAVGHGYYVSAFRNGCGFPAPSLFSTPLPPGFGEYGVQFTKAIPGGIEVHTYVGPAATCNFSTGRFKLDLGRLATINVTFHPRPSSSNGFLPPVSHARGPVAQTGTMTGTFRVDIDRSYFGSVNRHRTRGSIQPEASAGCGRFTEMLAGYGRGDVGRTLIAAAAPDGQSSLTIETGRKVPRTVAGVRGIAAADDVYLTGGPSLFGPSPDLTSAAINGPGGPVTGQLSYTENPHQPGSGTLFGSLRLAFDVAGTKILTGSAANTGGGPQLFNEFPCG